MLKLELEPAETFSAARIEECLASTRELELEDGRRLAYIDLGDPSGTPLFFFHGLPGSRLEALALAAPAARLGLRVIAADRPGIGRSHPLPGRRLRDQAADTCSLAERLGIDRFGVIGVSGGGPFAAACAFAIPERLLCAVDVSGSAPLWTDPAARAEMSRLDRLSSFVGSRLPQPVLRAVMALLGWRLGRARGGEGFVEVLGGALSSHDRELALAGYGRLLLRDTQEAFAGGAASIAHEARLNYVDWGFRHAQIDLPMLLVHGTEDRLVPVGFARWKHEQLRSSTLIELDGCGHFAPLLDGGPLLGRVVEWMREGR